MSPPTPSRRAALEVLRGVRTGGLADRALDHHAAGFAPRERGWLQELVYGALRLRGRIDHQLDQLVRGGIDALEPDVLDVLRLGAYQLLEMGSVPPYAAISQSVELARAAGAARAAGLVNGVLHALVRRRDELRWPDPGRDPVGFLSTWGSHPRWLVERWVGRWGAEEARALVEADNTRPELYLRPVGMGAAEAVDRLGQQGIGAEPVPFSSDSVRILPPAGAREALAAVPAVVQDPAASLVVRYAAIPAGAVVLDLCAAPGGKALGATDAATFVAAADVSFGRQRLLRQNVERLGLEDRVGLVVADGRFPPFRPARAVLLDAPCTGTGTLRRHPDGRWRVTPGDLAALVALQEALLEATASLVEPGGLLVYATCSLEREENEERVTAFLDRHREFALEPEPAAIDGSLLGPEGFLSVLPQRQGVDGSFAARMRRMD